MSGGARACRLLGDSQTLDLCLFYGAETKCKQTHKYLGLLQDVWCGRQAEAAPGTRDMSVSKKLDALSSLE